MEIGRDLDGLVRRARVQGSSVVGGDDGDGRDPELAAGAEDAQRDFSAVRDEQLADPHARSLGAPVRPNAHVDEARQEGARFSRNARSPS